MTQKILIFGAGKIGRSFIGQLFSRSGFEVVFVDVSEPIVAALNERNRYTVVIKAEREEVLHIGNVRGVLSTNRRAVIQEICQTDLLALSLGHTGLSQCIPLIAAGLEKRLEIQPHEPIDMIIAENLRHAAAYLKQEFSKHLPRDYPFDRLVGLIETSIGKMVPMMTDQETSGDILKGFAEPYNTLIVDGRGFKNPIPDVVGLAPKDNIEAWVDRKLFIHNLGHAVAAYRGYLANPTWTYLYEALEDGSVRQATFDAMQQSANILLRLYPRDFTQERLDEHIEDLVHRFRNRALKDTIFRVGCDLYRKLGPNDRLVTPIRAGLRLDLPVENLIHALVCGMAFKAKDQSGQLYEKDIPFFDEVGKGVGHVLQQVCGFDPKEDQIVFETALRFSRRLNLTSS